jgi:hypothetical protein
MGYSGFRKIFWCSKITLTIFSSIEEDAVNNISSLLLAFAGLNYGFLKNWT